MGYEDQVYHRQRAEQCRSMAELASDPEIRRRHQQLAQLHASRTVSGQLTEGEAVFG
jgi:hypothetical protein